MGCQLANKGFSSRYVDNVCDYVLRRLKTADTAIVVDRYYDFSIKSSTRLDRGSSSSQTHMLTLTSSVATQNCNSKQFTQQGTTDQDHVTN